MLQVSRREEALWTPANLPSTSPKFDRTQAILLEPEIQRTCTLSLYPSYKWKFWNEFGEEVLLTNPPVLNSPTLLIHPFYDNNWFNSEVIKGSVRKRKKRSPWPSSEELELPTVPMPEWSPYGPPEPSWTLPRHSPPPPAGALYSAGPLVQPLSTTNVHGVLDDGSYTAQLTIREEDTIIKASYNTTFDVVAIRLRVSFIDGTEREVDPSSNITLQVEVTSPTPNYTINWKCHPLHDTEVPCFHEPDPWDNFTSSSHLADGILAQLHHLWDLLHGEHSHDFDSQPLSAEGNGDVEEAIGTTQPIEGYSRTRSGLPPLGISDALAVVGDVIARNLTRGQSKDYLLKKIPEFLKNKWHYIETITFPASFLRGRPRKFVFRANCFHGLHKFAKDEQLIVVAYDHRDNIGIKSHIGSQPLFGASRRMVFESVCNSCTQDDIDALQYTWDLKVILSGSLGGYREEVLSQRYVELAVSEALRGLRNPSDGFMARPKDYLRVFYNSSILPYIMMHRAQEITNKSEDELLVANKYLPQEDLEKLPGPITANLVSKAWDIFRHSGAYTLTSHRGRELKDSVRHEKKGAVGRRSKRRNRRHVQRDLHPEEMKILTILHSLEGVVDTHRSLTSQEMKSGSASESEVSLEAYATEMMAERRKSTNPDSDLDFLSVRNLLTKQNHADSLLLHPLRTSDNREDKPDQPSTEDHPVVAASVTAWDNGRVGSPPSLRTMKDDATRHGNGEGQNEPSHHHVSPEEASHTSPVSGGVHDGYLAQRGFRENKKGTPRKFADVEMDTITESSAVRSLPHYGELTSKNNYLNAGKRTLNQGPTGDMPVVLPEVENSKKYSGASDETEVTTIGLDEVEHDSVKEATEEQVAERWHNDRLEDNVHFSSFVSSAEILSLPPVTSVYEVEEFANVNQNELKNDVVSAAVVDEDERIQHALAPESYDIRKDEKKVLLVVNEKGLPNAMTEEIRYKCLEEKEEEKHLTLAHHRSKGVHNDENDSMKDDEIDTQEEGSDMPDVVSNERKVAPMNLGSASHRRDEAFLPLSASSPSSSAGSSTTTVPTQDVRGGEGNEEDKSHPHIPQFDYTRGTRKRETPHTADLLDIEISNNMEIYDLESSAKIRRRMQREIVENNYEVKGTSVEEAETSRRLDFHHNPLSAAHNSLSLLRGDSSQRSSAVTSGSATRDHHTASSLYSSTSSPQYSFTSSPSSPLPTPLLSPSYSSHVPQPPLSQSSRSSSRVLDYKEYSRRKLNLTQFTHRQRPWREFSSRSTGSASRKVAQSRGNSLGVAHAYTEVNSSSDVRVGDRSDASVHGEAGTSPASPLGVLQEHARKRSRGLSISPEERPLEGRKIIASSHARKDFPDARVGKPSRESQRKNSRDLKAKEKVSQTKEAEMPLESRNEEANSRDDSGWASLLTRPLDVDTNIIEDVPPPVRPLNIQGVMKQYAESTGEVPDFSCPWDQWHKCGRQGTHVGSANHTITTLQKTLGDPNQGDSVMREPLPKQETFITENAQRDVLLFGQFTSTGLHEPVLVLYKDLLFEGFTYVLYLTTTNTLTKNKGQAKQLIKFSPTPTLKNCRVTILQMRNSQFQASCEEVSGEYYPVYLQWSYQFLKHESKTVFYHGTRTNFLFSLPPGLEVMDYKIFISVKALDGKGVFYKYPHILEVPVHPRSSSGDGVLSIFKEISTLVNESPSLLLQDVRSLTFELNLIESSAVTQTILDNILALVFYGNRCKDRLETVTDPAIHEKFFVSQNPERYKSNSEIFIKVNLLKSCARDHLAEIIVKLPVRDEMEVLQVLTALQVIVDAQEPISSMTYSRVITAMNTASKKMWWNFNGEVRTEAAKEYFLLSSSVLDKQTSIYDWDSTSATLSTAVIDMLLNVMKVETRSRFMEESPLNYASSTLDFFGYLADADRINKWNKSVPFIFEPGSIPHGVHMVQGLMHQRSPYNVSGVPITSVVINVDLHIRQNVNRQVKVKLLRSKYATGTDYDFRREGILTPQSLSVYEFEVGAEHKQMSFQVILQVTQVFSSKYPVAAVVLICEDLQNLRNPLYKVELPATIYPSQVQMSIPPGGIPMGNKLLIIMDKNSYENNWARHNKSSNVQGGKFQVGGWWAQCLLWNNIMWIDDNCSLIEKETTWDITTCCCDSPYSVYGAKVIPILEEESKINVNELMLVDTYVALYFIIIVLVLYAVMALALQTSERHRLKRRNIWLRDNKPEHEWAYLLTIKTGTQWNAGTTSKVYAIIHGTHGMSETRELQSSQTGQLFTRGSLCTFILTTAEPLGDILKVQVWHDNSGGNSAGWYVCETSVVDLVLGARYAYPCYCWLSVQAEDAKVEREITLESPTTFFQDFEHFLPQYASEHMLWSSLLTTSSAAKFFRLQRLTICLIVCLCLGTISLAVVQRINNEHTMMVPDMHIESLFYGFMIALMLLPVQWLLEMVFKMSNRLEEKEYNNKTVLDTLRASLQTTPDEEEHNCSCDQDASSEDSGEVSDDSELYDPDNVVWTNLAKWAQSVEVTKRHSNAVHPALLQYMDNEDMHVMQRLNPRNSITSQTNTSLDALQDLSIREPYIQETEENFNGNRHHTNSVESNTKKCSPQILHFFSELSRTFGYMFTFLKRKKVNNRKRSRQEDEEGWTRDEDEEDDDVDDEFGLMSNMTFIFSQCIGWIVCCFFVALCCMTLFVRGSGMPVDYSALWLHIIYVTLCCSVFIMQPLVVVIYTLYKVCMYRWLGCRGCISNCVTVPLDQVVAIWNRYQSVLSRYGTFSIRTDSDRLLRDRQRNRDLRFAHPPSEDHLLKCREKEMRFRNVSKLFTSTLGHFLFLALLLIIASKANVKERFRLNQAVNNAMLHGTCLDKDLFLDPCTETENSNHCNQIENPAYVHFKNISSKDDWWKWANSELLGLTYNMDENYSIFSLFCDTNSVILGQPRIRKYDVYSEECAAAKFKVEENTSFADVLKVKNCYPDYVDAVNLLGFRSSMNKEDEWDAHFLAVNHGLFSQYSYTKSKQNLPSSRFGAILMFLILRSNNWIANSTRAVVTEFTLYHPPSKIYTDISLLAEFPSVSGAKATTFVWSTDVERYRGGWAYVCMIAEILLLAVAMYYLYHTAIYLYSCQLRIWHSFWGVLDFLMTVCSWSYVVCLMLRVQIAEDIMWQLHVAYFRTFVNLKSLVTWDNILEAQMGAMVTVHLLRCLNLMKYVPRLRRLGLILTSASKDVLVISIFQIFLLVSSIFLGFLLFNTVLWEFHTFLEVLITTFRTIMAHLPILKYINEGASGLSAFLGYFYFLVNFALLYQLTRALFMSAFMYAHRSFVNKPRMDMTYKDIKNYVKSKWKDIRRKFLKTEETLTVDRIDNIPPDFYMAEIEMQISQIQEKLDSLATSFGIILDHVAGLEDSSNAESSVYGEEKESPRTADVSDESVISWKPEDFKSGKVRASTLKTELEAMLEPLQSRVQQLLECGELKSNINEDTSEDIVSMLDGGQACEIEKVFDATFNLDAFTEIASCQTEIEALSRKWNLSSLGSALKVQSEDNGEQLEKFLKDVSAASDEQKPITSFGKYGKTCGKFNSKFPSKLFPATESSSSVQSTSSLVDKFYKVNQGHQPVSLAWHRSDPESHAPNPSAVVSSNLRRTKTHGRGKGHVDVLDIESFKTNSDDEL